MTRLVLFTLLAACKPAQDKLPAESDRADSDADSDADTDTDSDADLDTAPDTGDESDRGGRYAGTLVLNVQERNYDAADQCAGSAVLDVDPTAEPAIFGQVECVFEDSFLAHLGPLEGVVEGEIISDPEAAGTLLWAVADREAELEWTGAFEGDRFVAELSGEVELSLQSFSVDLAYEGTIDASR